MGHEPCPVFAQSTAITLVAQEPSLVLIHNQTFLFGEPTFAGDKEQNLPLLLPPFLLSLSSYKVLENFKSPGNIQANILLRWLQGAGRMERNQQWMQWPNNPSNANKISLPPCIL